MSACGLAFTGVGFLLFAFMLILGAMSWSFVNESSPSGDTRDALRGMSITTTILSALTLAVILVLWRIS